MDWNKQWNPQILIENITGDFKESAFRSISQDSQVCSKDLKFKQIKIKLVLDLTLSL